MIIQVTDAVKKKEIVIPTIGYAVKAGAKLSISDEAFYNGDIQACLRKGLIVVLDAQGHQDSPNAKNIKITNVSGKPIGLDNISLLKNESTYVSRIELQSNNVRSAIIQGILLVKDPQKDDSDDTTETKSAGTLKKKIKLGTSKKSQIVKKKQADPIIDLDNIKPSKRKSAQEIAKKLTKIDLTDEDESEETENSENEELTVSIDNEELDQDTDDDEGIDLDDIDIDQRRDKKNKMQAWDPYSKSLLNKEESTNRVAKVVNTRPKRTLNNDGVMSGELDFTDKGVEEAELVVRKENKKSKVNKAKAVKPVGRKRKNTTISSLDVMSMKDVDLSDLASITGASASKKNGKQSSRVSRTIAAHNAEIE